MIYPINHNLYIAAIKETYNFTFLFKFMFVWGIFFLNHLAPPSKAELMRRLLQFNWQGCEDFSFWLRVTIITFKLIAFIISIETEASLLALAKSILRLNEIKVEKWVSYSCLTKGAAYTIKSKGSYRKNMMQFLRYAGFWVPEANVKLASTQIRPAKKFVRK